MITEILSTLTLFATSITAFFIFLQYRHQTKPILRIEVKDGIRDDKNQSVLESNNLYLYITNISKQTAENLSINCQFKFDNIVLPYNFEITHLYPNEFTKRPVEIGLLLKKYPELFEKHEKGRSTKIIPKKTLKINYHIEIIYNKLFKKYFGHKVTDSYYIEMGSLEQYPDFESHPVDHCWNKRRGVYIYKK